jgi:hypothetical protein
MGRTLVRPYITNGPNPNTEKPRLNLFLQSRLVGVFL